MQNSQPKIYKIALCSFGMSGLVFHAPLINTHTGFLFYAVWELTKNIAASIYPNIITYKTFDEILLDKNIDVVVINTPSITHYDFTKQALQAGKNVIVEKPFTATTIEAAELIALAASKKLLLSVFHNRRLVSDYKTVKKVIESNMLGDLKEVEINFHRFTPALSIKPHKEANTGAVGILYDLGSHIIDQALQLFGMPQALFADIMRMRAGSLVDDYFEIILYYPTFRVRLKASFFAKEPQGYIVHGSKGSFTKSMADVQEEDLKANKNPLDKDWGIEPTTAIGLLHYEKDGVSIKENIISEVGNYMEYYNEIYSHLLQNNIENKIAVDAKKVIRIIELAMGSYNEKKVIEIY